MKKIKIKGRTDKNGDLKVNIPTHYPEKPVELIFTMHVLTTKKGKNDFTDLSGKLKWKGDPVREQRKQRNAW